MQHSVRLHGRVCVSRARISFSRLSVSRGSAASLSSLGDPLLPDAVLRWTRQPGTEILWIWSSTNAQYFFFFLCFFLFFFCITFMLITRDSQLG